MITCPECGTEVTPAFDLVHHRYYCPDCGYVFGKKIEKLHAISQETCPECGTEFETPRYDPVHHRYYCPACGQVLGEE